MEPAEDWLTIQELATVMGVGVDKVRARIKTKRWPHFRDGRTIRFTPEHVQHIKDIGHIAPKGRRK
jgi:excisionase family DNA binding protein